MHPDTPEILASLSRLYEKIDAGTNRLRTIHAGRMRCRPGCWECCMDDISVNEVEAAYIQFHCGDLLRTGLPHPVGACAFLNDERKCRIYERRPYVCRSEGLPLQWAEERGGKTVVWRDICPHNEAAAPIEELPENECWKIGPIELELAKLQNMLGRGIMKRVRLRALFDYRSG
jgi:uncharacterized protein